MEVNGSPGEEEEMMMIMSKGKHPFSSPPCSSSSNPYHQYHNDRQPPPSEEEAVMVAVEKEHMFDKVVTPSDVGKLNRLVIPKQHAERYFPLDSSSHEKGLLLSFEDLSGKPWSFRYSYWNSSQSYVMTKGWSRFVKDKKLDAGDVISFHRSRDKLFIDWRRRPDPPSSSSLYQYLSPVPSNYSLFMPPPPPISHGDGRLYWPNHHLGGYPSNNSSVIYMRPAAQHQGGISSAVMDPRVYESVPVVQAAAHKRLRLFGVNMDICPITTTNCDAHHQIEDRSSSTTISFSAAGGRNS